MDRATTCSLDVAGADVRAALGEPAAHTGFTFQAAELKLTDGAGPLEFPLHDFAGQPPPAVLRLAFEKQYDAAWVRARIPRVFGFTPQFVEVEDSALMDVGFVAAPEDRTKASAFVCADRHGRAGLYFARWRELVDRNAADARRVAQAFWSLLLARPDDLADFEQIVYHEPSDVWLKIGCLYGKLFCEQSED